MEKRRNSRTSNLKSATTKAKATVKSTVEKIEKTPAAEKPLSSQKGNRDCSSQGTRSSRRS